MLDYISIPMYKCQNSITGFTLKAVLFVFFPVPVHSLEQSVICMVTAV